MEITQSVKTGEIRSTRDWQAKRKCELAKVLENIGDYESARRELADRWVAIGDPPLLDGLAPDTQAELLWRVGTLTGYLGSAQQLDGAQELAKDLLTQSIRRFEELNDHEKVAEVETDLSICYWREGAMDEARVRLQHALGQAESPATSLRVSINAALVEIFSGQCTRGLAILDEAAPLLDRVLDHATKGRYHMHRALALKKLGAPENLDRALIENSAASFHFDEAGHKRYLARIENNLGSLLLEFGRHDEALLHLDKSRHVFIYLKDSGSVAQVNETQARLFLAQGRYSESERAAFSAVSVLAQGGEPALLVEALITQGTARARLGHSQSARSIFLHAVTVAEAAGYREAAGVVYLTAIGELQRFLSAGEILDFYNEADLRLTDGSEHASRLRACARIALSVMRDHPQASNDLLVGGSFKQEVKRFEAELIRRALDQSAGSVTSAAKLLGVSHQAVSDLIKHKHKALQSVRTPRRSRHKSIIKR
jgi:tetratricopeptide (TPR) repeat protein